MVPLRYRCGAAALATSDSSGSTDSVCSPRVLLLVPRLRFTRHLIPVHHGEWGGVGQSAEIEDGDWRNSGAGQGHVTAGFDGETAFLEKGRPHSTLIVSAAT